VKPDIIAPEEVIEQVVNSENIRVRDHLVRVDVTHAKRDIIATGQLIGFNVRKDLIQLLHQDHFPTVYVNQVLFHPKVMLPVTHVQKENFALGVIKIRSMVQLALSLFLQKLIMSI
jgi:hypothetical protein